MMATEEAAPLEQQQYVEGEMEQEEVSCWISR